MTLSLKSLCMLLEAFFKSWPKAKPLDVYKIGPCVVETSHGVNFINVLFKAIIHADPKSAKR